MIRCWSLLCPGSLMAFGAACIALGDAPQSAAQWLCIVWVVGSLAALGAIDGARLRIDMRWLAALVAGGSVWWAVGSDAAPVEALAGAALGAAAGFALAAAPIAVAELMGRRWPLYPGDALLLAGMGWVLGPMGLLRALLAGSLAGLAYGGWVQARRGRSLAKGYLPLGPGMAVGAIGAFLGANLPRAAGPAW